MILAVTGHRPNKLGGYGRGVEMSLLRLAGSELRSLKPESVLTGMALGWDTAIARAAIALGIPFTAVVPFDGQEGCWPMESRRAYYRLLKDAKDVVTVCTGGYASWKMLRRDRWLVDNAEHLLALYSGAKGGTAHCVEYAQGKGLGITNCWGRFKQEES